MENPATDARPSKFYRYRSIADERLKARVRGETVRREAFFSSLRAFNDPFETGVRMDIANAFPAQYRARFPELGHHLPDPAALPEIERKAEMRATESAERFGLFCLSAKPDDILMWSHYAAHHTGLCLEYGASCGFFEDAVAMQYRADYPVIQYMSGDTAEHADTILRSKARHWQYEDEWRVFACSGPGMQTYEPGCLTGVILGCRMPEEDRLDVQEWAVEAEDDIALYEAKPSRSAYALEIHPLRSP